MFMAILRLCFNYRVSQKNDDSCGELSEYQEGVKEFVWKDWAKPAISVIEIRIRDLNPSETHQNYGSI